MNDEQLTLLEGHVMAHQKRMHHQLTQLREKKSKVDELFFATAMKTAPTTGYDVKTATALTNCNNECEQLPPLLVSILLQITTLTDGLPSAEWAHARTKRLWESYEHGLQKILNKSLQHEGKLLQLANRPGVVPTLFMNAAHRFSFYEVIRKSTVFWTHFMLHFSPRCMRQLATLVGLTFANLWYINPLMTELSLKPKLGLTGPMSTIRLDRW
jgi:hypothetical protein